MNSYGNFETPKKGLSGGLKAIVAVIIIVGIIANAFGAIIIGGIVAAIMQIFAPVTVFDAGLYALYNALPQTVIFETLLYSDVIVDIDGELRGDVFPTIGDDAAVNLDGSIYYSYYDGAAEGK